MAEEFDNIPVESNDSENNQNSGADENEDLSYFDEQDENTEDENTEDEESEDDGEDEVSEQPKKKSSGFKKRIDKLTKEKTELANRIRDLEEKYGKDSKPTPSDKEEVKSSTELKKPVFDDFDGIEDYVDAMADYKIQLADKNRADAKVKQEQEKSAEEVAAKYTDRLNKAKSERYKDFDQVFPNLNDVPNLHQETLSYIMNSELGPDLVYYMAKNPSKAKEIASSKGYQQIAKLADVEKRLQGKLSSKSAKKEDLPDPINPVSTPKGGDSTGYRKEMSAEEYIAWRSKQLKNKGK